MRAGGFLLSSQFRKSLTINDLARPGFRKSFSISNLGKRIKKVYFFLAIIRRRAYCVYSSFDNQFHLCPLSLWRLKQRLTAVY